MQRISATATAAATTTTTMTTTTTTLSIIMKTALLMSSATWFRNFPLLLIHTDKQPSNCIKQTVL